MTSPYIEQCLIALGIPAPLSSGMNFDQLYQEVKASMDETHQWLVQRGEASEHGANLENAQSDIGQRLRRIKAKFDVYATIAEAQSAQGPDASSTLAKVGAARSAFANQCLDIALLEAWQWACTKNLLRKADPVQVQGLYILGLGKLGGKDLNFSSDVDLVSFYDRDTLPFNPSAGRSEAAGKILARLGRTLSDPLLEGAEGRFVWRVDWRLRPDPSVNPLAISTGAAIDYYYFHADPWERLAFAKADFAAGDRALAHAFLKELGPFIWRRNLDFQALDEIAALKETIHARHPGLVSERERTWQDRGPTMGDWAGFNLKLGVGGIREVEFLTQAFQVLWGGREINLQHKNCLRALAALGDQGILPLDTIKRLSESYGFLRRAENALQAFQNQQTQNLPTDPSAQAWILAQLGLETPQAFAGALADHTRFVSEQFDSLLAERGRKADGQAKGAEGMGVVPEGFKETLDDAGAKAWSQLELGAIPVAKTSAGRQWLTKLLPWIASVASRSQSPSQTTQQMVQFLARQPLSASYLETLHRFEPVRDAVAKAFTVSPAMKTLVEQSPFMIDRLVSQDPGDFRTLFESQLKNARDQEAWLERLRRIVNEELFATYSAVLSGTLRPHQGEEQLTKLAREAIRAQMCAVAESRQMAPDDILNQVNVIAMGKLGMGRMVPLSDLDLIFVNMAPERFDDLRAFMSRFITGMTTKMREGIAYDLDLRLRPNGRSGPPAINFAAFEKHHQNAAKTWEHLALSAGRVLSIGPDGQAGIRLEQARQGILTQPRDLDQLRLDAARMLVRLRQHRIRPDATDRPRLDVKLRPGGLMETEYLIAYLTLHASAQGDHALCALRHDERAPHLSVPELPTILRFWRDAQWCSRLLGLRQSKEDFPPAQLELFTQLMGLEDLKAFEAQAQYYGDTILSAIDQYLPQAKHGAEDPFWADYSEQPVRWLS